MGFGTGHTTNHRGRRATYRDGGAAQTVFENGQLAHIWAQQTQDFGRSGNGNFYFDGPVLYSYGKHFPVAQFTGRCGNDGKQVVLVTGAKSSITTTRHISLARRALHGLPLHVVVVPDLRDWCDSTAVHRAVVESYAVALGAGHTWFGERDALEAYRRAFKVKARLPADCARWYQEHKAKCKAQEKREDIRAAYGCVRKLPRRPLTAWDWPFSLDPLPPAAEVDLHTLDDVIRRVQRIAKQANATHYQLTRAPATKVRTRALGKLALLRQQLKNTAAGLDTLRQLRQARERLERAREFAKAVAESGKNFQLRCYLDWAEEGQTWRFRDPVGLPQYPPDWTVTLDALDAAGDDTTALRAWMQQQASLAFAVREFHGGWHERPLPRPKARPDAREAWLRGEPVSFYQEYPTLVRRRGERLETSRQAHAPWREVVVVFKIAQACRLSGGGMTYDRPAAPVVGRFYVRAISAEGDLTVGCHEIAFDEMLRLAVQEVPEVVRPRYPLPVPVNPA